jgi:hypothetical protein
MTPHPNTVAIYGDGGEAAEIVLRSVLKLKEHDASAIIIDHTGRGALVLTGTNKMSMERFPVLWINTADRRRPAALFQFRVSEHLRPVMCSLLGALIKALSQPENQCFNYLYGMLYGEVLRAVMKAGLDPYFGLMHGSKRDQGSLVFDIIEEFRAPFADRLIIGMMGRGFKPEIGAHGFLKTRTRKQLALCFSKNWAKKIRWRSRRLEPTAILTNQTRSVAKLFSREGEYQPYRMKW